MAVYRPNARLLARQIASLSAQTMPDWSCLIGIDGADAGAHELVTRLAGRDARLSVREYPENRGVYRHFERLLAETPSEADWVALSDQDDVWHPRKLERLSAMLDAPGVTVAMCQAHVVDEGGRRLGETHRQSAGPKDLLLRNQVTGSLAVFSAATVRQALPFPQETSAAVHDHWLAVFATATGEMRLTEERLQDYVQHEGNVLGEEKATSVRDTVAALRAGGGVRAHLDAMARERWGWRVNLASGLEAAGVIGSRQDLAFVRPVADGRFTAVLVREVVASWRSRRLRGRAAASTLVSAWWFARHRSSHAGEPR